MKTDQPVAVSREAVALAEDIVSAANIVSHDGYYEIDIDKVAAVLASRLVTRDGAAEREVPFEIEFSRAYINGAMEDERAEIRRHWNRLNDFLSAAYERSRALLAEPAAEGEGK